MTILDGVLSLRDFAARLARLADVFLEGVDLPRREGTSRAVEDSSIGLVKASRCSGTSSSSKPERRSLYFRQPVKESVLFIDHYEKEKLVQMCKHNIRL